MKAEDTRFTRLFEGPKQFIVPVFQRDYSWGTKHCLQLWKDIVRAGIAEREVVVDEAYLEKAIQDPMAEVLKGYPPAMPENSLSATELKDVIDYVRGLQ